MLGSLACLHTLSALEGSFIACHFRSVSVSNGKIIGQGKLPWQLLGASRKEEERHLHSVPTEWGGGKKQREEPVKRGGGEAPGVAGLPERTDGPCGSSNEDTG